MRRACFTIMSGIAVGLLLITSTSAFDLTTIERKIAKLPELKSPQPLYCLLVFGPDAKTRVWLVRDGDVLYADRNANGDLTEPGERIEADAKVSEPDEGVLVFHVGDIVDGPMVHKALGVTWFNVDHLRDKNDDVTARLKHDPRFRALSIRSDVAMPNFQGRGIDGRIMQHISIGDVHGLLDFSPQITDAPILHFGGPWQITLSGKSRLRIGRNYELYLDLGTPGLGPGATVSTAYDRVIPPGIRPRAEFTFPSSNGETVTAAYDFKRRCCTYNLYDEVLLPEGVAPGIARVTLSLDQWQTGHVAPSTHLVEILPSLPGPKIFPVSARLTSKLEHLHPDGDICNIHFSPDGRRVIAGDYPGGVAHIWDLTSGERLVTIPAGEGARGSDEYFEISPDWRRIYTSPRQRGNFNHVERDGKRLTRVSYNGEVYAWDAITGKRLATWQQDPPRGVVNLDLMPNGDYLFVLEETPGEFTGSRPRAVSLLDVRTGTYRELAEGWSSVQAVTDDSRLAAAIMPKPGESSYHGAIAFFTLPEWKELNRIPLGGLQRAYVTSFAKNGQIAIGVVTSLAKRDDWQSARHELNIWDVATGRVLHSMSPALPKAQFGCHTISPDGNTAVVGEFDQETGASRILLLNLTDWTTREVTFAPDTLQRGAVFHPSGKWLAVSQMTLPKQVRAGGDDPPATTLPQPRIQLIDTTTGRILETIVAPQSYQMSIALSPDGNTLATGGNGAVLLWDMTAPPGESPAQPVVGQAVELAGATVDGKLLDPAAYRGKVTLVSFWATWCQPCVAEMPQLKSIYHELHERGFEVVGVSVDEHGGGEQNVDLAAFVKNQSLPWAVLHGDTADNSGMRHPLAQQLGVTSVPRSFLLDGAGKIVAIDPTLHELEKLVEPLLQK